ncbi:peptidylprolyl isomerase [Microlunatus flavus]|uniref:Peptidyl-prolyl cis-trans isomerase n=1 Tax=Microlunatus flavus TaxID=1036181 RepID=A0A1H9F2T7_9ACTN|nr:peptidylprolyl isomerase [Microlunatus flavus]SEQ32276.1 peptidyl-prolyl cis-trans isomerase B (cyclophilin B) [Microlunatus flavus]
MPSPSPRRALRLTLLLAGLPLLLLPACGTVPTDPTGGAPSSAAPAATPTPGGPASVEPDGTGPSDGACEYTVTGSPARPVQPPTTSDISSSGTVSYVMHLSEGDVTLKLDRAKAPCTVHSFESLVAQKYFDDTRCHRLVDSGIFVLQCGDPTATGRGGPGYTFPDETDGTEKYTRGTLAMANAGPNTNGSQFFLVWDDSPLPPSYTVFGSFDEKSREVVAGIASQGQDGSSPDGSGVPNSPAKIKSITKAS